MDRLSMAFCEGAIDLLALMGCENMEAGGTKLVLQTKM